MSSEPKTTKFAPATLLVCLGAIFLVVLVNTPLWPIEHAWVFLITLGLMAIAAMSLGFALNGRPLGLVIDNRNRASLSKLQMLLWTILVLAALTSLASARLIAGTASPLSIDIPGELLAAMGIAAGSFVAAPTLLSLKANETPTTDNLNAASTSAQAHGGQLDPAGKVHGRADPSQASWTDLFRGDEVGNQDSPDLSKVQQIAITLLLLGIYTATIVQAFARTTNFATATPGAFPGALPPLDRDFIILMGISHATYLVYKAAPHTASGDSSGGQVNDPASDGAAG